MGMPSNNHSDNQSKIADQGTSYPGATGQFPGRVASVAKIHGLYNVETRWFPRVPLANVGVDTEALVTDRDCP
jgi:hypothetical protein